MLSSIYTKPSALVLCLLLSACGGGGKSDNDNTAATDTSTHTAPIIENIDVKNETLKDNNTNKKDEELYEREKKLYDDFVLALSKWEELDSQTYLITKESSCSCNTDGLAKTLLIENNQVVSGYVSSIESNQIRTPLNDYNVRFHATIDQFLLNLSFKLAHESVSPSTIERFISFNESWGYPELYTIREYFSQLDGGISSKIVGEESLRILNVTPLDQIDCEKKSIQFAPIKLNTYDDETNELINCDVKIISSSEIVNQELERPNGGIIFVDDELVCHNDATILLTPEDLSETITIEKAGYHSQTVEIENTNQDCSLMPIELDVYLEKQ